MKSKKLIEKWSDSDKFILQSIPPGKPIEYSELRLKRLRKKLELIGELQNILYEEFEKEGIDSGPMMGNNTLRMFMYYTGMDYNRYRDNLERFKSRNLPTTLDTKNKFHFINFREYYGMSYSAYKTMLMTHDRIQK